MVRGGPSVAAAHGPRGQVTAWTTYGVTVHVLPDFLGLYMKLPSMVFRV